MTTTSGLAEQLSRVTTLSAFHEVLASHRVLDGAPRFLVIELDVSNKCNLRCRMCHFSYDEVFHRAPVYLTPETFSHVADGVLPHTRTLSLSLGSEPSMSPYFATILRMASKAEVPNTMFYTNGTLLDEDLIATIVTCRVTEVCVSIDGATKATYEHIRRGANFDRVVRNVRALAARRRALWSPTPRIRFDVVMMRRNIEELEAIVSLASELGAQAVNFFHMVAYEGLDNEHESLVHSPEISDYWLRRALVKARELGVTVTAHPKPFRAGPAMAPAPGASASPFDATPYCTFPFYHVSMNSEGQVMPCPFSHGEGPYGSLGNGGSFERLWLNERFTDLRRRILEHDPPSMCQRCSFLASRHPQIVQFFKPRKR